MSAPGAPLCLACAADRRPPRGILGRRRLRRERLHLDEELRPRERGDHEQRRSRTVAAEEFRANLGESSEILVTGQKRGDFHHVTRIDRKSTRLNSSHMSKSYAV